MLNNTEIKDITANWCKISRTSLEKLIKCHGVLEEDEWKYSDNRKGPIQKKYIISDVYKEDIAQVMKEALSKGVPCNARYFKDALKQKGIGATKRTINRTVKRWNFKFGALKAHDNRKERAYVIEGLRNYILEIEANEKLPQECQYFQI